MRKLAVVFLAMVLAGSVAVVQADDSVTLAWTPPTHRVENLDCAQVGEVLTPTEALSLEHTLSYRVKGTTPWENNIETGSAITWAVLLSGYEVTYEFVVGSRFPGGEILCVSGMLEYTTAPNLNPPGPCSAFTATKN